MDDDFDGSPLPALRREDRRELLQDDGDELGPAPGVDVEMLRAVRQTHFEDPTLRTVLEAAVSWARDEINVDTIIFLTGLDEETVREVVADLETMMVFRATEVVDGVVERVAVRRWALLNRGPRVPLRARN